jgi:hypothetical protein
MNYRKLILILPVFLLVVAGTTRAQDQSIDLTGKWENTKKDIYYEFKPDSSASFSQSGYPVFINKYSLDLTRDPGWIDFTMEMGPTTLVIEGLIKIIDDNNIWIEQFGPHGAHPTEFSTEEKGNIHKIHVLKRVGEE